jgi:hypothetical protein
MQKIKENKINEIDDIISLMKKEMNLLKKIKNLT